MKTPVKTAISIGIVSVFLASTIGPLTWYFTKENAEESMVKLTTEESKKILMENNISNQEESLKNSIKKITGGMYDIAEIYDNKGTKIIEGMSENGEKLEKLLPHHKIKIDKNPSYESLHIDNKWILRIFVPLKENETILGYFEGIRVVPEWQEKSIQSQSLITAFLVAFSSLFCGFFIYPVVRNLSKDNERKAREVLDSHISMMEALGRAIAKRDSDTGIHNYRVAWISACIAEKFHFKNHDMQSLIAGSFLHDVGKIGIPDQILLKPGKLTEDEFQTMKTHVNQGNEIVQGIGFLDGAWEIVSGHHEKWNGSGYPSGKKEKEIPLSARIFAIADVFDALTSKRPYKEPFSYEKAMEIIKKDSGSHFDPEIVKVFIEISGQIYEKLSKSSESEICLLLENTIKKHFEI